MSSLFPQIITEGDLRVLRESGYDGIVYRGTGDPRLNTAPEVIFLSPEQVKSAIGNDGTFSPANKSILRAVAPFGLLSAARDSTSRR